MLGKHILLLMMISMGLATTAAGAYKSASQFERHDTYLYATTYDARLEWKYAATPAQRDYITQRYIDDVANFFRQHTRIKFYQQGTRLIFLPAGRPGINLIAARAKNHNFQLVFDGEYVLSGRHVYDPTNPHKITDAGVDIDWDHRIYFARYESFFKHADLEISPEISTNIELMRLFNLKGHGPLEKVKWNVIGQETLPQADHSGTRITLDAKRAIYLGKYQPEYYSSLQTVAAVIGIYYNLRNVQRAPLPDGLYHAFPFAFQKARRFFFYNHDFIASLIIDLNMVINTIKYAPAQVTFHEEGELVNIFITPDPQRWPNLVYAIRLPRQNDPHPTKVSDLLNLTGLQQFYLFLQQVFPAMSRLYPLVNNLFGQMPDEYNPYLNDFNQARLAVPHVEGQPRLANFAEYWEQHYRADQEAALWALQDAQDFYKAIGQRRVIPGTPFIGPNLRERRIHRSILEYDFPDVATWWISTVRYRHSLRFLEWNINEEDSRRLAQEEEEEETADFAEDDFTEEQEEYVETEPLDLAKIIEIEPAYLKRLAQDKDKAARQKTLNQYTMEIKDILQGAPLKADLQLFHNQAGDYYLEIKKEGTSILNQYAQQLAQYNFKLIFSGAYNYDGEMFRNRVVHIDFPGRTVFIGANALEHFHRVISTPRFFSELILMHLYGQGAYDLFFNTKLTVQNSAPSSDPWQRPQVTNLGWAPDGAGPYLLDRNTNYDPLFKFYGDIWTLYFYGQQIVEELHMRPFPRRHIIKKVNTWYYNTLRKFTSRLNELNIIVSTLLDHPERVQLTAQQGQMVATFTPDPQQPQISLTLTMKVAPADFPQRPQDILNLEDFKKLYLFFYRTVNIMGSEKLLATHRRIYSRTAIDLIPFANSFARLVVPITIKGKWRNDPLDLFRQRNQTAMEYVEQFQRTKFTRLFSPSPYVPKDCAPNFLTN